MNKSDIYFYVFDKIKKVKCEVVSIDFQEEEVYIYDEGRPKTERWRSFSDVTIIEKSISRDSHDKEVYTGDILKSQLGYILIRNKYTLGSIINASPIDGEMFELQGSIYDNEYIGEVYQAEYFVSWISEIKEMRGDQCEPNKK